MLLLTKKLILTLISLTVLCLLLSGKSFAYGSAEKILDFDSQVIINPNATIDVTETIRVNANDAKILHGIVRRLLTRYKDSYGVSRETKYKIREVLLNGQPSAYHIEHSNNQLAVYIGSLDTLLPSGVYTYTIKYHAKHALNFLKEADEFYWNVTGNEWDFPIDKVKATIHLPAGATILRYAGYSGAFGEKGDDYIASQPAANQIIFETTKPLMQGEGLTIAIAWPKGILHQPLWVKWQGKNQYWLAGISLMAIIYYLLAWALLYKRRPKQDTGLPQTEPLSRLSPAAMRYLYRMGFDVKTFTAAIVSLATKGYLTIHQQEKVIMLTKRQVDNLSATPEETSVLNKLFAEATSVTLCHKNRELIRSAKQACKASLRQTYEGIYFKTHLLYLVPGILLTLAAFIAAILLADDPFDALISLIWFGAWTIGSFVLIYHFLETLQKTPPLGIKHVLTCLGQFLYLAPFLLGEIIGIYIFTRTIPIFTVPLLFFTTLLNVYFYFLLRMPTSLGSQLITQVEGFKLFLTTKHLQTGLNRSEKLLNLYEYYLPYAIALSVEDTWGKLAATENPTNYRPLWYTSTTWDNTTAATFPAVLNLALTNTLITSHAYDPPAPSSSPSSDDGL